MCIPTYHPTDLPTCLPTHVQTRAMPRPAGIYQSVRLYLRRRHKDELRTAWLRLDRLQMEAEGSYKAWMWRQVRALFDGMSEQENQALPGASMVRRPAAAVLVRPAAAPHAAAPRGAPPRAPKRRRLRSKTSSVIMIGSIGRRSVGRRIERWGTL